MITNDARCTSDIKSRIATAREEEDTFHQQIGLKLKKKTRQMLHLEQSQVWCWKLDTSECIYQNYMESFEMLC